MKTALIFGSTGLVGNELLKQLQSDPVFNIKTFTRKPSEADGRVTNHVINFERVNDSAHLITGDVLFCCLGTTIRNAGSQSAFRAIDYDLVVNIARIASANGVKKMLAISSIGADASSGNFYLKTKGQMEHDLQMISFLRIKILRPSILTGHRKEFRLGEKAGIGLASIFAPLMMGSLKKYRPVNAAVVAKAMIVLAENEDKQIIYESDSIQALGK